MKKPPKNHPWKKFRFKSTPEKKVEEALRDLAYHRKSLGGYLRQKGGA